jgi:ribosomal protein S18 acetylase RimI-like enzyme
MTILPAQLTVRSPRHEDASIVVDLIIACQRADGDEPDMTVDELLKDWHGVDLGEEAILVLGPEGNAVGYADILHRRYRQVNVYAFVQIGSHWETIWTYLVAWGESWARSHAHLGDQVDQVSVYHFLHENNRAAQDFLTAAGYNLVRTHYIMEARLEGPPPAPIWPAGIALRTFQAGEDGDAFYEAGEAAFQDSWNRPPSTKERWLQPTLAAGFDPTLWFLPYDIESGQIAGLCLCSIVAGVGMVDTLGVRRRWRRQGLGLAMLNHAFGEFWQRDVRMVSLNVDAGSPTGAPRLYERAGFKVQKRIHRYEKKVAAPRPMATVRE